MKPILLKKYSKFQKFNEIFYWWITSFRNVQLGVFRQYQKTKPKLKKKNISQNCFNKRSKFNKFYLSNFTLTWSKEGKVNSVRPDMTYSKELQQKEKMLEKFVLKTFELNIWILVKYCVVPKSRNSNHFLMGIERSLSHKGIIKI